MQEDPAYLELVKNSFILKDYHRHNKKAFIPQIKKQQNIIHKLITTTLLSSALHIIAYPLDTIKTRIMSRSKFHDVARFQLNKVAQLTLYVGFFKGYLSILVGNLCFLTIAEKSFYLGVGAEAFFKSYIDISKISSQMGNSYMKSDVVRRIYPSAIILAYLRDLVYRSSYQQIVGTLIKRNEAYLKKDVSGKYHFYYIGALISTILSHPFDLLFTKLASQRSLRYTGLFNVFTSILKQEGGGKLMSGLGFRLVYNLIGTTIMSNGYEKLLQYTIQAY